MVVTCCVPSCNNKGNEISLHRFPIYEEDVYNIWLNRIQNQKLCTMDPLKVYQSYKVCDAHFSNFSKFATNSNRTNLICRSVPTVNLPGFHDIPTKENSVLALNLKRQGSPLERAERHRDEDSQQDFVSIIPETINMDDDHPGPSFQETIGVSDGAQADEVLEIPGTPKHNLGFQEKRITRQDVRKRMSFLRSVNVSRAQELTPKARKLYSIACSLKKTAQQLDKDNVGNKNRLKIALEFAESEEFLKLKVNKTSFNFIMSQLKLQTQKEKGRRFTVDDKIFALSLMKHGAKGYRILRKTFALPSRKTLNCLLSKVPLQEGFNDAVFKTLKKTVEKMEEQDKHCILMFDEMTVDPSLSYNKKEDKIEGFEEVDGHCKPVFADHATVFMLKGVQRRWKQPICYFFTESGMDSIQLAVAIKKIIVKLQECGLYVCVTVCDQHATNRAGIKRVVDETNIICLKKKKENKYFGFTVQGKEIVPIYDAPHLLKGIRNNLMQNNVLFKDENGVEREAKWDHITFFHELNCGGQEFRMCSKLTDAHVCKDKCKKMKVSFAAQVCSASVSSCMESLVRLESPHVFAEMYDTAVFLKFMDKLFDSVNGSSLGPLVDKPLRGVLKDGSPHHTFWNEAVNVLRTIKFVSNTREFVPPSVTNWIHTIRGFQYIYKKLQRVGIKKLCLRDFNQDPLENLFGCIRSHGVRNVNPTCKAFTASFKSILVNNFMSAHSPGANCEADSTDGALNTLREFVVTEENDTDFEALPQIEETEDDFTFDESDWIADNVHSYLAGYIAKRIFKKIGACQQCKKNLIGNYSTPLISARAYSPKALTRPTTKFSTIFGKSCQVMKFFLPVFATERHITQKLIVKLNKYVFNEELCCDQHNINSIFAEMFTQFYIYTWTKNVNKILKGVDSRYCNDTIKAKAFAKAQKQKKKKNRINAMKNLM